MSPGLVPLAATVLLRAGCGSAADAATPSVAALSLTAEPDPGVGTLRTTAHHPDAGDEGLWIWRAVTVEPR